MIIFNFLNLKKCLKKLFFSLLIIALSLISIYLYRLLNSYTDIKNNINSPILETEFITKESIINKLKSTNKLITLEVELSQTIKIDKSFGSSDLFSNSDLALRNFISTLTENNMEILLYFK